MREKNRLVVPEEKDNVEECQVLSLLLSSESMGRANVNHPLYRFPLHSWRLRERLKTVSVGLVVCLNIGVDPPDVIRTNPCARLECWIDPGTTNATTTNNQVLGAAIPGTSLLNQQQQQQQALNNMAGGQPPASKALDAIIKSLQQQYEFWQPRARYRPCPDPTVDEVKKMCMGLRRAAKEERVLLHYNGHGVPRPTKSGEIWVFNKEFTQYIPLSIFDVQSWLGFPSVLVYDCSAAGNLLDAYKQYLDSNSNNNNSNGNGECIQLAACRSNESLPMNPDLPADLFTACLTTPIEIAIRWAVLQQSLLNTVPLELAIKVPGRLSDRRTPLGELNWIFTAITDAIAWTYFPRDLFRRLFRQDLMVASLCRNFLLAERIMSHHGCRPLSIPALPSCKHHKLWDSWDLVLESCLSQLEGVVGERQQGYTFSSFFSEQLSSFEKWLNRQSEQLYDRSRYPAEQLPIVLQVLLSQSHRVRALFLISRYLKLGPWAVSETLSVGIFPYVVKLLQSPAVELCPVLLSIWSRLLAVDQQCQGDLLKDNGFHYFVNVIVLALSKEEEKKEDSGDLIVDRVDDDESDLTLALFILSVFVKKFPHGQRALLRIPVPTITSKTSPSSSSGTSSILDYFFLILSYSHHQGGIVSDSARRWTLILLANLVEGSVETKIILFNYLHSVSQQEAATLYPGQINNPMFSSAASGGANGLAKLINPILKEGGFEVRASLIYFLGRLMGDLEMSDTVVGQEHNIVIQMLKLASDPSPLVRRELIISLSTFVYLYQSKFVVTAYEIWEEERGKRSRSSSGSVVRGGGSGGGGGSAIYSTDSATRSILYSIAWKALLTLATDPFPLVSELACHVVDEIHRLIVPKSFLKKQSSFNSSNNGGGVGTNNATNNANVTSSSSLNNNRRVLSLGNLKESSTVAEDDPESGQVNLPIVSTFYESHLEHYAGGSTSGGRASGVTLKKRSTNAMSKSNFWDNEAMVMLKVKGPLNQSVNNNINNQTSSSLSSFKFNPSRITALSFLGNQLLCAGNGKGTLSIISTTNTSTSNNFSINSNSNHSYLNFITSICPIGKSGDCPLFCVSSLDETLKIYQYNGTLGLKLISAWNNCFSQGSSPSPSSQSQSQSANLRVVQGYQCCSRSFGKYLALARAKSLSLYDLNGQRIQLSINEDDQSEGDGDTGMITSLSLSDSVVMTGNSIGIVKFYDIRSKRLISSYKDDLNVPIISSNYSSSNQTFNTVNQLGKLNSFNPHGTCLKKDDNDESDGKGEKPSLLFEDCLVRQACFTSPTSYFCALQNSSSSSSFLTWHNFSSKGNKTLIPSINANTIHPISNHNSSSSSNLMTDVVSSYYGLVDEPLSSYSFAAASSTLKPTVLCSDYGSSSSCNGMGAIGYEDGSIVLTQVMSRQD